MTSGIYALYWWEEDLIYVGLTKDLLTRKDQHLRLLKRGVHHNYKLQNAYNLYGVPSYIVLEETTQKDLSSHEIKWGNEFNSLGAKGLNIAELGVQSEGTSKYSRLTLLKVFRELYLTKSTFKSISVKFNVTPEFAMNIFYSKNHLWLQEKYPKQYTWMKSIARKDNSFQHTLRKESSVLVDPNGVLHECCIIRDFAREHRLIASNLNQVILGNRLTHKGWKLYEAG